MPKNKCDKGHTTDKPLQAGIIDGKFGNWCPEHTRTTQRQASPLYATSFRDAERRDNERDMIQPWDANGNINPEFVREYPEESAEMFTQTEIEQALRDSV